MTGCIPTISWILGPLWLLSQRAVLAFSNLEGGEWTSVRSSWICIGLCGYTKGVPLGALKTKTGGSCWVSYLGAEKSIKTWLPSNVCSANLKCFLGWQHNTKCPNQDTGLVQRVCLRVLGSPSSKSGIVSVLLSASHKPDLRDLR